MPGLPWSVSGATVFLRVRLTPKADRDCIDGIGDLADGDRVLDTRVRAVPEKGAANTALIALVAKALGVPRSSLSVGRGVTAKVKSLTIADAPSDVLDRLASLVK